MANNRSNMSPQPNVTIMQQQQQGGGLFGATQPQQGGGLFGATQPQQQSTGGLFGQPQQQQQGGGLFGGNQPQQQGSSLFGGATQQPATGVFNQDEIKVAGNNKVIQFLMNVDKGVNLLPMFKKAPTVNVVIEKVKLIIEKVK